MLVVSVAAVSVVVLVVVDVVVVVEVVADVPSVGGAVVSVRFDGHARARTGAGAGVDRVAGGMLRAAYGAGGATVRWIRCTGATACRGGGGAALFVAAAGAGAGAVTGSPAVIEPSGGGSVPPTEPGWAAAVCPVGSVKLVVVSVEEAVVGGGVSPGALMVDEAPVVDPSWTTSYCCCSRCMLPLPPR